MISALKDSSRRNPLLLIAELAEEMGAMEEPNCIRCQFYFMTWSTDQPHGCHAFGFKSKTVPSRVVEVNSEEPCGYFQERPAPPPKRTDLPLW